MNNQGRQGGFSSNYPNNMAQGWRNNPNQGFGWKQETGSSNRQAPYQQQPHYPSIHERTSKFSMALSQFTMWRLFQWRKGLQIKCYNLDFIGQLCSKMHMNMFISVIVSKELELLPEGMK